MHCMLFINHAALFCEKLYFIQFEKKVSFYCPYFAADKVPPYPSKDKVKDYSECCGDKCCTKVSDGITKRLRQKASPVIIIIC